MAWTWFYIGQSFFKIVIQGHLQSDAILVVYDSFSVEFRVDGLVMSFIFGAKLQYFEVNVVH